MEAHPNTVQFAGDYRLDGIILHNHQNEGINVEDKGIDIQKLVVEMNLFESIYKNSMTGSLVIADSINLIGKLPIQGTERLSFNLKLSEKMFVAHAAIKPDWWTSRTDTKKTEAYNMYGNSDSSKLIDFRGERYPIRLYNWVDEVPNDIKLFLSELNKYIFGPTIWQLKNSFASHL